MLFGYYIRKLDFLGHKIGFEHENRNQYSTNSGALFSIITFLSAFAITIMFGREIYERKNPYITTSKENIEDSKIYLKDFPIMFSFTFDDGEIIDWKDYIDFYFDITVTEPGDHYLIQLPMEKCENLEFSDKVSSYLKEMFAYQGLHYYCQKHTNETYFSNEYGLLVQLFSITNLLSVIKLIEKIVSSKV